MKDFKLLRNELNESVLKSKGNVVYSKKVDGVSTEIIQDGSKFIAFIDGDKLDTYNSQKEAEKMITQFIKQFKG